MKLYNSILSNIDESIAGMESAIDPFNILGVILITPEEDFLGTVRLIDDNKLKHYTADYNPELGDKLLNSSVKFLMWDYDLKEKCLRFIWFICNKVIPKLEHYWDTPHAAGMFITFDELITMPIHEMFYGVTVAPYNISGSTLTKGQFALAISDISGKSVLVLYTNNLRK